MFKTIAAVFLLSLFVMPAHAATIEWDLDNVSVVGNPSITLQGYFDFDTVKDANGSSGFPPNGPSNFSLTAYQNGVALETWEPVSGLGQFTSFYGGPTANAPPVYGFTVDGGTPVGGGFNSAQLALLSTSPLDTPLQHVALVAGNTNPYNESGMFGLAVGQPQDLSGFLDGHVAATPLPAAFPLFGTALVGLGSAGWFRRRKAAAA